MIPTHVVPAIRGDLTEEHSLATQRTESQVFVRDTFDLQVMPVGVLSGLGYKETTRVGHEVKAQGLGSRLLLLRCHEDPDLIVDESGLVGAVGHGSEGVEKLFHGFLEEALAFRASMNLPVSR